MDYYIIILFTFCVYYLIERLSETTFMANVRHHLVLQGYTDSAASSLIDEHYGELLFAWGKDWNQQRACRLLISNRRLQSTTPGQC